MTDTLETILALQPIVMAVAIALVHAFTAYARRELARAQASADTGDDARAAKLYERAMKLENVAQTIGDLLTLGLTYRQRLPRTPGIERVERQDRHPEEP